MATAIAATDLTKTFGRSPALDGLNLTVRTGRVHGFLGPNGAGKSTTLRILLGLIRPDGGTATVLGADPWKDAVDLHRRLAYVPGDVRLWPSMTAGEAIDLLGSLRGRLDRSHRDELIDRFALDPTTRCRACSTGNRQKIALIAALACDVELYVLDEPTSGLDPLREAVFQQVVSELADQGRTVLLSSHILSEVETLCHEVTIVRAGRAVRTGTVEDLRALGITRVTVHTTRPVTELADLSGVHDLRTEDTRTTFTVDRCGLNRALTHLTSFGVLSLSSVPPSLEEIFLQHYDAEPSTGRSSYAPLHPAGTR